MKALIAKRNHRAQAGRASHQRYSPTPIILFTASASDIPKVAKEIGADDCITKPFEPEELLEKIKFLLKEGFSHFYL